MFSFFKRKFFGKSETETQTDPTPSVQQPETDVVETPAISVETQKKEVETTHSTESIVEKPSTSEVSLVDGVAEKEVEKTVFDVPIEESNLQSETENTSTDSEVLPEQTENNTEEHLEHKLDKVDEVVCVETDVEPHETVGNSVDEFEIASEVVEKEESTTEPEHHDLENKEHLDKEQPSVLEAEKMDAAAIEAAVRAMQQASGEEIFDFTHDEHQDTTEENTENKDEETFFSVDVIDLYEEDDEPVIKPDTETVDAVEIEAAMLALEEAAGHNAFDAAMLKESDNEEIIVVNKKNDENDDEDTSDESLLAKANEALAENTEISHNETENTVEPETENSAFETTPETVSNSAHQQEKMGWAARLKQGLTKSRDQMAKSLATVFGGGQIDEDLYEELETVLLTSDMGIEATEKLMNEVRHRVSLRGLNDGAELRQTLKDAVYDLLKPLEQPLEIPDNGQPFVIMMAGINGAGKTTSIGKLAKYFQSQGKSVVLAAGDTFRAAAREQLQEWGKRNDVTVISQVSGDSAAVCFDAVEAAKARKIDIVLADTAGRLPTQLHLMEEIKKVKRVLQKAMPDAPHEVMVVLDANIGQNAVNQVVAFNEALGVTGLVVTKLDGTAKGGVLAALVEQGIPVRYIGVGEKIDDLRPFDTRAFVDALFGDEH